MDIVGSRVSALKVYKTKTTIAESYWQKYALALVAAPVCRSESADLRMKVLFRNAGVLLWRSRLFLITHLNIQEQVCSLNKTFSAIRCHVIP